jgi:hypothetical protein
MTTSEKEKIIEGWPYPWPQHLSFLRKSRDAKFDAPDSDKQHVRVEYERQLNRLFEEGPTQK